MTKEEAYVKYNEIYKFAEISKNVEDIVNVEELMVTPVSPSRDSGLAYEGSVLFHTLMVWYFAKKLLPIYGIINQIDVKSLAKVVVLHQLGKVGMFEPNTDEWQVSKAGKVFVFKEQNECLKNGERSKLFCSNAGITFTPEEYEAMSILDKTPEEYENMAKYRTHLSTILKISSDLSFSVARERYKKNQSNGK